MTSDEETVMRTAPPVVELPRFPIVGGTALLAIGATIAWLTESLNMSALVCDPHVRFGQPWRLVTSALLHVNYIHLGFNIYWLWVLGSFVEETFGHAFTFALIVLLAAGSSAAEYAVLEGGVGLSGVGYGLFGLLWVLSRHNPRYADVVDRNTVTLFVAWFFICIVATYADIMPVANIAHGIGGLLGAIVGWGIVIKRWRWVSIVTAVLLTAGFCAASIWLRPEINLSHSRGLKEASLGDAALNAEDYRKAEQWYREAVTLNPRLNWAWQNLGVALYHQRRFEESAQALARAASLAPTTAQQ